MSSIVCISSTSVDISTMSSAHKGIPQYSSPIVRPNPLFSSSGGRSLIYNVYRWVERTPPCLTPCFILQCLLVCPFHFTCDDMSEYRSWITFQISNVPTFTGQMSFALRVSDCCLMPFIFSVNFSAISWREQVNFQWVIIALF